MLFDSAAGIDLPPQKRRIGYLFQDHALFPHMTVMENISCGSEKNAREYIDRFYLRGKEDLRPHQLSGGEKQRTAIARTVSYTHLDVYKRQTMSLPISSAQVFMMQGGSST